MADAQCLIESDATGHSEKFKQGLHAMRNDSETSDVTFICEDMKVVKEHKMILKTFSPVLREIIRNIPVTSAVVYLKGINSIIMDPLLDFMYCGKVSIDKYLVPNFFKLGKQFEVELLSEYWDSENDIYDTEEGNREDGEVLNDTENDSKKNENIETFACPRCYKKFEFEECLKRHFLKYHENSQANIQVSIRQKFSCPECDKKFCWVSHVKRHMKSVHEGIRYQCDHCDYTATQKVHLRYHLKKKHSTELTQKLTVCQEERIKIQI